MGGPAVFSNEYPLFHHLVHFRKSNWNEDENRFAWICQQVALTSRFPGNKNLGNNSLYNRQKSLSLFPLHEIQTDSRCDTTAQQICNWIGSNLWPSTKVTWEKGRESPGLIGPICIPAACHTASPVTLAARFIPSPARLLARCTPVRLTLHLRLTHATARSFSCFSRFSCFSSAFLTWLFHPKNWTRINNESISPFE